MSTTTNMSLNQPSAGTTGWDTAVNDNWSSIDAHDHSSGKGTQVPLSGIKELSVSAQYNSGNAVLYVYVQPGQAEIGGSLKAFAAQTNLTVQSPAASSAYNVYVDPSGTIQCTTSAPAGTYLFLAIINIDASMNVTVHDQRAVLTTGGGGGGTSKQTWTWNSGIALGSGANYFTISTFGAQRALIRSVECTISPTPAAGALGVEIQIFQDSAHTVKMYDHTFTTADSKDQTLWFEEADASGDLYLNVQGLDGGVSYTVGLTVIMEKFA